MPLSFLLSDIYQFFVIFVNVGRSAWLSLARYFLRPSDIVLSCHFTLGCFLCLQEILQGLACLPLLSDNLNQPDNINSTSIASGQYDLYRGPCLPSTLFDPLALLRSDSLESKRVERFMQCGNATKSDPIILRRGSAALVSGCIGPEHLELLEDDSNGDGWGRDGTRLADTLAPQLADIFKSPAFMTRFQHLLGEVRCFVCQF